MFENTSKRSQLKRERERERVCIFHYQKECQTSNSISKLHDSQSPLRNENLSTNNKFHGKEPPVPRNWSNFHSINSNSMLRASELNRRKIPRKKKNSIIHSRFVTSSLSNLITTGEWRRRWLVSYPTITILSFATFNRIEFHSHCLFKNVGSLDFEARYFHTVGRRHLDTAAPPVTWPASIPANHRRETIRGAG